LPIADWRLPIDGLTNADFRSTDWRLANGEPRWTAPADAQLSIMFPPIGNQQSVDRHSPIDNPSIGTLQSPVGNDD